MMALRRTFWPPVPAEPPPDPARDMRHEVANEQHALVCRIEEAEHAADAAMRRLEELELEYLRATGKKRRDGDAVSEDQPGPGDR